MEYLTSIFILLIIIAPFAIFARQIRRVRIRTQSWLKAAIWFVLFAICPVCLYALLIAALVAVEELTKLAIVTEEIARTFIFVIVISLGEVVLLSVIFSILAFFLSRNKGQK